MDKETLNVSDKSQKWKFVVYGIGLLLFWWIAAEVLGLLKEIIYWLQIIASGKAV